MMNELLGYAMGDISLKISKDLLESSYRCADALHLSWATYICRAIERMNRQTQGLVRTKMLTSASKKVRKESRRVNRQFASIDSILDDTSALKAFHKGSNQSSRRFNQIQKQHKPGKRV